MHSRAQLGRQSNSLEGPVFKSCIDSLSDAHWKAIIDGTRTKIGKRKTVWRVSEVTSEAPEIIVSDDDDDDILFDPMFA